MMNHEKFVCILEDKVGKLKLRANIAILSVDNHLNIEVY